MNSGEPSAAVESEPTAATVPTSWSSRQSERGAPTSRPPRPAAGTPRSRPAPREHRGRVAGQPDPLEPPGLEVVAGVQQHRAGVPSVRPAPSERPASARPREDERVAHLADLRLAGGARARDRGATTTGVGPRRRGPGPSHTGGTPCCRPATGDAARVERRRRRSPRSRQTPLQQPPWSGPPDVGPVRDRVLAPRRVELALVTWPQWDVDVELEGLLGWCRKNTCHRPSRTSRPLGSLAQPRGLDVAPGPRRLAHPAARPRPRSECRLMISSRPGPTPMADTRAPMSSSRRST